MAGTAAAGARPVRATIRRINIAREKPSSNSDHNTEGPSQCVYVCVCVCYRFMKCAGRVECKSRYATGPFRVDTRRQAATSRYTTHTRGGADENA